MGGAAIHTRSSATDFIVTKLHPWRGRYARVLRITTVDGVSTWQTDANTPQQCTNKWPWTDVLDLVVVGGQPPDATDGGAVLVRLLLLHTHIRSLCWEIHFLTSEADVHVLQHIFFRCKLASRGAALQGDMVIAARRDAEEASTREADALATVADVRRQLSVLEAGMTMERAARDVAVAHVVELTRAHSNDRLRAEATHRHAGSLTGTLYRGHMLGRLEETECRRRCFHALVRHAREAALWRLASRGAGMVKSSQIEPGVAQPCQERAGLEDEVGGQAASNSGRARHHAGRMGDTSSRSSSPLTPASVSSPSCSDGAGGQSGPGVGGRWTAHVQMVFLVRRLQAQVQTLHRLYGRSRLSLAVRAPFLSRPANESSPPAFQRYTNSGYAVNWLCGGSNAASPTASISLHRSLTLSPSLFLSLPLSLFLAPILPPSLPCSFPPSLLLLSLSPSLPPFIHAS